MVALSLSFSRSLSHAHVDLPARTALIALIVLYQLIGAGSSLDSALGRAPVVAPV